MTEGLSALTPLFPSPFGMTIFFTSKIEEEKNELN